MKFKVQLIAFGEPGEIREVDVPEEKLMNLTIEQQLELVYLAGQNEFDPQHHASVSPGDVIEYEGEHWLICEVAFRKMTQAGYDKYLGSDRVERFEALANLDEFCVGW